MTLPTLCEHCHNKAHRDDIKCTESCYSLDAYNQEIAKAIAARDKWWINRLNEEHIVIRLTDDQDEFAPGDYIAMPLERWHVLKREVGQ
jgi:hypothetical protein